MPKINHLNIIIHIPFRTWKEKVTSFHSKVKKSIYSNAISQYTSYIHDHNHHSFFRLATIFMLFPFHFVCHQKYKMKEKKMLLALFRKQNDIYHRTKTYDSHSKSGFISFILEKSSKNLCNNPFATQQGIIRGFLLIFFYTNISLVPVIVSGMFKLFRCFLPTISTIHYSLHTYISLLYYHHMDGYENHSTANSSTHSHNAKTTTTKSKEKLETVGKWDASRDISKRVVTLNQNITWY